MTTGPLQAYRALVVKGTLSSDLEQERAAQHLGRLYDELCHWAPGKKSGPLGFIGVGRLAPVPQGIYLWGDVGRGKSMLMDMFFDVVPTDKKVRVHFHEFMSQTHGRIHAWRQREKQGKTKGHDPIPPVAAQIAAEAHLICFDEFQVHDITDASILGRLFTALFKLGVVVVATSNRPPDGLYEHGLNRQRFLPFIDLVTERMEVLSLDSERDYRLDRMMGMRVYHTPIGREATEAMDAAFFQLTDGAKGKMRVLTVKGRDVEVPHAAGGVARFDFEDLCARPLGASDYLEIADTFDTVLIDNIPAMSKEKRNEAKRFVTLIDALYERKTRLIVSAEALANDLYPSGDGAFEFERTVSRLMEMQSEEYLGVDPEAS